MILKYTIVRFIGYLTVGFVGSGLQISSGPFWALILAVLLIEFSTRWETEEIFIKLINEATTGSTSDDKEV